mmetsp:Transcript_6978/g.12642  ORF Transcript_6978/g.12642 Transcript_6978/m.12642 type:complete len:292 (-) Transcript_6978:54-929(-)
MKILRHDRTIPMACKFLNGLVCQLTLAVGPRQGHLTHGQCRKPSEHVPHGISGRRFRLPSVESITLPSLSKEGRVVDTIFSEGADRPLTIFKRTALLVPVDHLAATGEDLTTAPILPRLKDIIHAFFGWDGILSILPEEVGHGSGHGNNASASARGEGGLTITLDSSSSLVLTVGSHDKPRVHFHCVAESIVVDQGLKVVHIKKHILTRIRSQALVPILRFFALMQMGLKNWCQKCLKIISLRSQAESPIHFPIIIVVMASVQSLADDDQFFNGVRNRERFPPRRIIVVLD